MSLPPRPQVVAEAPDFPAVGHGRTAETNRKAGIALSKRNIRLTLHGRRTKVDAP